MMKGLIFALIMYTNSWRHEPHSVYIDEAVRKYAKGTKDAKQIEKDLRFFIAD